MTLVAAYRPKGIPVLLGDFLVTGGPGLQATRKKISKIGPNFVIGWTGRQFLAAPILGALVDQFRDQRVTMKEVEEFLINRPPDELNGDDLYLVGWVIDELPHCFLWNIANPDQLFYEASYVVGTGEKKFQELLTKDAFGGAFGSKRTSVEEAIYSALAKATELYADENLDKLNRADKFGHGYELLYFDGNEFRYVENIAFFGMDILFDPTNFSGRSQPHEHWYRYHSLGDAAFLQDVNFRSGAMVLELIEPVFHRKLPDASFKFTAGSFHADYYCIFLRLTTTAGENFTGSLVLPEKHDGPSRYAKLENGTYTLDLGSDLIKFMYQSIKAEIEHRETNTISFGWGSMETREKVVGPVSLFQARLAQNDKCVVIGLIADAAWDKNYETMQYAMMACADERVQIYERAVAVGPLNEHYNPNDVFTLSMESVRSVPIVRYYRNAKCVYESLSHPSFPLRGAVCLREDGASISESRIVGNWVHNHVD